MTSENVYGNFIFNFSLIHKHWNVRKYEKTAKCILIFRFVLSFFSRTPRRPTRIMFRRLSYLRYVTYSLEGILLGPFRLISMLRVRSILNSIRNARKRISFIPSSYIYNIIVAFGHHSKKTRGFSTRKFVIYLRASRR